MKAGISIVLCTFNGAARLPQTLRHIARQKVLAEVPWELIVVDNASTDATWRVIEEEWSRHQNPVSFTLLYQPKQGLTYAREMAFQKAQYDYILMCDDDNWLDENYVNVAFDLMQKHPSIGVLGGYGELEYETEPPYYARALPLFANGSQAAASGKVPRNFVYGAGSVIRKPAYDNIIEAGFKPLLTDRTGPNLNSGGDYEICFALVLAGYDIWYDERLKFKHFMVKERLTLGYYLRFFRESSYCFEVLDPYEFVTTFGANNIISFNKRYFQGVFYHLRKISLLYLKKMKLKRVSEEAQVNSLKIFACKRRLSGYKKYSEMIMMFRAILKLKNEKLIFLRIKENNKIPEVNENKLIEGLLNNF